MASVKQQILNKKEAFLAKCTEDERAIFEAILRKKELEKNNSKKKAKELAEITKEFMSADLVCIDDDSSITVGEMLISRAAINGMRSPKFAFKDVNDVQKVIDNDTNQGSGGLTVIINNNGQDLGD